MESFVRWSSTGLLHPPASETVKSQQVLSSTNAGPAKVEEGVLHIGSFADCLQPCCTGVHYPTRRIEGGQRERERERERERGQQEKTIARLTGEKTVRHD